MTRAALGLALSNYYFYSIKYKNEKEGLFLDRDGFREIGRVVPVLKWRAKRGGIFSEGHIIY